MCVRMHARVYASLAGTYIVIVRHRREMERSLVKCEGLARGLRLMLYLDVCVFVLYLLVYVLYLLVYVCVCVYGCALCTSAVKPVRPHI